MAKKKKSTYEELYQMLKNSGTKPSREEVAKAYNQYDFETEDIAPVKVDKQEATVAPIISPTPFPTHQNMTMNTFVPNAEVEAEKRKPKVLEPFKKSKSFEDGYQFGDIFEATTASVADLGLGAVKGGLGVVEGVGDAVVYGTAWIPDILGADKVADYMRHNIAKPNVAEDTFAPLVNRVDEYSVIGRTLDSAAQGVGQMGLILGTGGMLGTTGMSASTAGNITIGMLGMSSVGSGTSEAYQYADLTGKEVTDEQALVYGLGKGVIDTASEMLFGGLGKGVNALGFSRGISSLDDAFAKKLSSVVTNQLAKNGIQFGVKAMAEGSEEVIAGLGSAVLKKLTYMKDEDLKQLIKDENLLEQFVSATLSTAVIQSGYIPGMNNTGSLREANKQGRDYITGLNQNEQTVIEKVFEDTINKRTEAGEKLTRREERKIYEEITEALERGELDTDAIGRIFAEETYNRYMESAKQEEEQLQEPQKKLTELKEQLESLEEQIEENSEGDSFVEFNNNRIKNQIEDTKKLIEETESQIEDIKRNSGRFELQEQMDAETFAIVNDSKLAQSYVEKGNRRKGIEVDLDSYSDENVKQSAKNFMEYGANNTKASHDFLELVTKVSKDRGRVFKFMTTKQLMESIKNGNPYGITEDAKRVEAFVSGDEIIINMDANKAFPSLVGHEITHTLESDMESYGKFQKALFELAKTRGEYDSRWESIQRRYPTENGYTEEKQLQELTSDLVGDYIFGDSNYVQNLATENPNVFQKIWNEIKYLWKMATAGSKEKRQLEIAKKKFEDAWRKAGNTADSETKFSVADENIKVEVNDWHSGEMFATMSYTQDGKVVGTLEYSVYDGEPNVKMVEVLPEYRRKGIGTKLLQELQRNYPDVEINYGMTTPDGAKLLENATYTVENKEVSDKYARLEEAERKIEEYDKGYNHFYDNNLKIPENYAQDYDSLLEEIYQLRTELRGKKPTTTLVKGESSVKYSVSEENINKITEDGLTMTYVRNPNAGTANYGRTYGQNLEPAGEYMNMDTSQGKYKIDGWEYGTIQFKKPLVLDHINTGETGWKKTLSDMYGGLTGKRLTRALIKDGYDAIVTQDEYGYSEIVNLNGTKLNDSDVKYSVSDEDIDTKIQKLEELEKQYDIAPTLRISDDDSYTSPAYGRQYTGSDLKLETSDVAPMEKSLPVDYAPLTEEEANIRDDRQIDEHFFLEDMVEAEEETYDGEYANHVEPADPFFEKDIWEVGKDRKQKAYMYEHPEVKPFFQEEASYMLGELYNSQKGEKTFNDQLYYDTNGEMGWFGTKRFTSEDIAYLLDTFNYTYKDIEKGLKAIIEDNGKENNAISKRIEFIIDERLRSGYTGFMFGEKIPPNQDYINLLNSKQITEYNDDAWNNWLRSLSEAELMDYAGVEEDIAPVAPEAPIEAPIEHPTGYAPLTVEEAAERDAERAEAEAPKVGRVILEEEEQARPSRRNGLMQHLPELVLDKGFVFENLAKKTKNRELEARWNSTRYAENSAQTFIREGAEGVRPLRDIRLEVAEKGLEGELFDYLYHLHNVDRMTLAERYEDMENKPVFGNSVTADVSRREVSRLESEHPELVDWAEEIYAINKHLRGLLVQSGVITQETADLWDEMYPHYMPIRRTDKDGNAVDVPLDTKRTGVDAPIKRAKGGNSDIGSLFITLADRTLQTYKAAARNRFGTELLRTLNSIVESTPAGVDDVADGTDTGEGILQPGQNGKAPTFTVFDNGERVTFEITDKMYEALKPAEGFFASTGKLPNAISSAHRGVLTEYNIAFMARNFIKDTQDVLINSQHPVKTYKNIFNLRAIKEIARKGDYYQEYVKNGGEQNTYFDRQTRSFEETLQADNKTLIRTIGSPIIAIGHAISNANNFIEKIPRMAEYIASRESGRSIDVSMLDAARVTTNFAAGGDLTKLLNRNGCTFLNASVQGLMQNVRNVREAKMNGLRGWAQLAAKCGVASVPAVIINALMWHDDEEYEELSDYVKQNFYVVGKFSDGRFVRIPKGRVAAVLQNGLEQMINLATGNDETDLKTFLELVVNNLAPNNPLEDNIFAPIDQVTDNKTWYGKELVPTRLQDVPKEEQFDESTDALSKWLGEHTGASPYNINYLLQQYTGFFGDTIMPYFTPEAETADDSGIAKFIAPVRDAFVTDSVLKNQNVTDFYETADELKVQSNSSKATDEDILKNKYFSSKNTEIGKLYGEKREIQSRTDLTDSEKYYLVRELQKQINEKAKTSLNDHANVRINGSYATVGDLHYRLTDNGWTKLTDDQINNMNEVSKGLGITPAEYWNNKEEYDMQYKYPEKYKVLQEQGISAKEYKELYEESAFIYTDDYDWASKYPDKYSISKAISDDVKVYKQYMSELNEIKADKDSNGKTINGSSKKKKADYINSLDLDDGQKAILYRSLFDSKADKDKYNDVIIDYLNERDDISAQEMREILEALDMKIDSKGRITW